jgi:two-component system, NarL family, nitrate/nitrite response regulator NarL
MNMIRVLLVEDHDIVRSGLRALLEAAGDMRVIGEVENGQLALEETERLRPDVVLLDLAMPLLNGVEAARRIAHAVPAARVLVLSSYSDEQHLRQAVQAGVAGYLMKECAADDLVRAVRETRNGGAFFSPPLFRHLVTQALAERPDDPGAPARPAPLSSRHVQVLQLISEGYATKQIGGLLSLSTKTVEKCRQTLMDRLDCHSIAELTRYAVGHGIVELSGIPNRTPDWPLPGPRLAGVQGKHSTEQRAHSPTISKPKAARGQSPRPWPAGGNPPRLFP